MIGVACEDHQRWIRLEYADGSVSNRRCPECPRTYLADVRRAEMIARERVDDYTDDDVTRFMDELAAVAPLLATAGGTDRKDGEA